MTKNKRNAGKRPLRTKMGQRKTKETNSANEEEKRGKNRK